MADRCVSQFAGPPRTALRRASASPIRGQALRLIQERLFQPFVSSKETGLGLGLSICQRLIEAHGGNITGDNTLNGGAIFSFTLPAEVSD